jgi:hypothetical protein
VVVRWGWGWGWAGRGREVVEEERLEERKVQRPGGRNKGEFVQYVPGYIQDCDRMSVVSRKENRKTYIVRRMLMRRSQEQPVINAAYCYIMKLVSRYKSKKSYRCRWEENGDNDEENVGAFDHCECVYGWSKWFKKWSR